MVTMNAITDPWIPCTKCGVPTSVSLQDIFKVSDHNLQLSATPFKQIPIRNFLVAIATAALRPSTNQEILGYLNNLQGTCDKILLYLDAHKDSFNLFDSKAPLFQVAFLDTNYPMKGKGFTRRETHQLVTREGYTTVKIKSKVSTELEEGEILLALLTSQVVGCNMKYGVSKPAGPGLKPSGQVQAPQAAAPFNISTNGGSTSTLNLSVRRGDLLETVILNMISEEDLLPIYSKGFGKPFWEYPVWDDFQKMLEVVSELTETFLGRLVPITKFLWVDPENPKEMIYSAAEGLDYQAFLSVLKEGSNHDRTYFFPPASATGKATLGAYKEDSYLWQEQASLDVERDTPLVLRKFKGNDMPVSCVASALLVSASMGLITVEQEVSSSVSWPEGALSAYLSSGIAFNEFSSTARRIAEGEKGSKGWNLSWALSRYCAGMNLNPKGSLFEALKKKLRRAYWERMDKEFTWFLEHSIDPDVEQKERLKQWQDICISIAKEQMKGLMDNNPRNNKEIIKACL